jgi:hypothetical protein
VLLHNPVREFYRLVAVRAGELIALQEPADCALTKQGPAMGTGYPLLRVDFSQLCHKGFSLLVIFLHRQVSFREVFHTFFSIILLFPVLAALEVSRFCMPPSLHQNVRGSKEEVFPLFQPILIL